MRYEHGSFHLTATRKTLLDAISQGKTMREIAQERGRSYHTIKNQVAELIGQYAADTKDNLARMWLNGEIR